MGIAHTTAVGLGKGKLMEWWIESFGEGRSCWWIYVGTMKICVAAHLTLGGTSTHFFLRESHSPSTKQLMAMGCWGG